MNGKLVGRDGSTIMTFSGERTNDNIPLTAVLQAAQVTYHCLSYAVNFNLCLIIWICTRTPNR
jgi:hypothetical protein